MLPLSANAAPQEGELFGYVLGDTYKITDKTQGRWFLSKTVIAEEAVYPEKIDRVEINLTPITNVIGAILGKSEFHTMEEAKKFAKYYASLFQSKYGGKVNYTGYDIGQMGKEGYMADYEIYRVEFHDEYELVVHMFEGNEGRQEKPSAYIILTYLLNSSKRLSWQDKVKQEFNELEIEAARNSGGLKGIE